MRWVVFLLVLLVIAAPARARDLQLELSDDRVDITTGFNGTKVVLFGTANVPDADLVIVLKGPERTMAVREKGRVLGMWMNRETVEFRRVPSYYDFATTLSESALARNPEFLADNKIGVDYLDFYPEDDSEEPETLSRFRDALIRSMQEKGFYLIKAHNLRFIDENLFKANFDLPPGVPTGIYQVEAMLVKDKEVLAKETKTLQVGQVGFNARVYLFAANHSFFYGVFAVVMALVSGWSAFTFLRRD